MASTLYIKFMLELLASISGARNATPSGFLTQIVKGKWAEGDGEGRGRQGRQGQRVCTSQVIKITNNDD